MVAGGSSRRLTDRDQRIRAFSHGSAESSASLKHATAGHLTQSAFGPKGEMTGAFPSGPGTWRGRMRA